MLKVYITVVFAVVPFVDVLGQLENYPVTACKYKNF